MTTEITRQDLVDGMIDRGASDEHLFSVGFKPSISLAEVKVTRAEDNSTHVLRDGSLILVE
jgi:hypothetical protein